MVTRIKTTNKQQAAEKRKGNKNKTEKEKQLFRKTKQNTFQRQTHFVKGMKTHKKCMQQNQNFFKKSTN